MTFTARALHLHGHHARLIDETSPEAAAVAYVEDFAHDIPNSDAGGGGLAILVRDEDTGSEQCFRVDLETGETEACAGA
ncbi:DUF5961 family protein [Caulobacter sp. FWC2]|uniref:DUF5961 family protein n=1 Tax=Caulobacter sp. FWC2 TaxID=69664 RepID=UPI000C14BE4F|nr:DUF5961 family protein [Caulobacter sp. FWC2]PIB90658.1 hypothetical protein CSW62_03190 [Caulobacter sp. FWC2]